MQSNCIFNTRGHRNSKKTVKRRATARGRAAHLVNPRSIPLANCMALPMNLAGKPLGRERRAKSTQSRSGARGGNLGEEVMESAKLISKLNW
jgi:hypothetical protein